MAITTATELKNAIANWMIRSDLNDARVIEFVALAESRLSRILRVRDMETTGDLTTDANGAVALPATYLEWVAARMSGNYLRYAEPNSEEWRIRFRPFDNPQMFTILGGSIIVRPLLAGTLTFTYYRTIPPLASNSTNWLLTRAPDLYLHTALFEACVFTKDDARALEHLQIAATEMEKLVVDGDSNKVARRPSRTAEMLATMAARAPETRPVG